MKPTELADFLEDYLALKRHFGRGPFALRPSQPQSIQLQS
jgi:hypothetical protein